MRDMRNPHRRPVFETRANPAGYNQYKHMSGSGSPSAQKALKDGPRALAGGSSVSEKLAETPADSQLSRAQVGDALLNGGITYSQAEIATEIHVGNTSRAGELKSSPSEIGQAMLDGGQPYAEAKTLSDKVAASRGSTVPTDKGGTISKTQAAEKMFGTGSKQHLAAKKKFGA